VSFTVLAGDFKKGAGHAFSDGKLVLIKQGDDDLKEGISGKAIVSIAVKKTEGATRGLVPFECALKDGRSFVAETDINTYKNLTLQAQDNKKSEEQAAPVAAPSTTAAKPDNKTAEAIPVGTFGQMNIVFKVLGALIVAGFVLSQLSKCGDAGGGGEKKARETCIKAIRTVLFDPTGKSTILPYTRAIKRSDAIIFNWGGNDYISVMDSYGYKKRAIASCKTTVDGEQVTRLTINGKTIIGN